MTEPVASDGAGDGPRAGEAVGVEESLYRRLPVAWYRPGTDRKIPQRLFMPRVWESDEKPGDCDGVSVDRKGLTTVEAAAVVPHSGKRAHVCELGVGHVVARGLKVGAKPERTNPAHAVIPELNSVDRRDPVKERVMNEHAIFLRDRAVLVFDATAEV
ncbi:MAG TPA: hypothetical protein VHI52_17760 [Verrucomicrobiae bacterium]|nr:hypothetical protein [Verrucomicrobiae bacterium]